MTPIPLSDWLTGLLFLIGLLLLVAASEQLHRRFPGNSENLRKMVHVATGALVLPVPFLFTSYVPVLVLSGFFAALNLFGITNGRLVSFNVAQRNSLGTFYYPISLAMLLVFFWQQHMLILLLAFALMAFADAFAAFAGANAPPASRLPLPGDTKTVRGTIAMFASSVLILGSGLLLPLNQHDASLLQVLVIVVVTGLIATASEVLSHRGSDNLTVPLLSACALYILLATPLREQFIAGTLLALAVAAVSYRLAVLDLSGAIATFLLGAFVFGIGGWLFSIPILFFFGTSSALSKLPRRWAVAAEKIVEKGARRDVRQVLANGLLPGLVVLASLALAPELAFVLYLGAVASATADTWATEIGLMFSGQPRSILTGRKVSPGSSGGVSVAGSFGALFGAALIALTGWLTAQICGLATLELASLWPVLLGGFLAQYVDSLIGATLQRTFRCQVCHCLTERRQHCDRPGVLASGKAWIDNDVVNLACGFSGLIFTYIFYIYC